MYMRKENNIRETISGKQNAAINAKSEASNVNKINGQKS